MPWMRTLVMLALAAATGCWTDACVHGAGELQGGLCEEHSSGILDVCIWTDSCLSSCAGEAYPMSTCRELGYSVDCDGLWYRPESAVAQACLRGP